MKTEPVRQNDFAFGEISPRHAASGDRNATARSLKKGQNCRITNAFGFKQRFGSYWLQSPSGDGEVETLVVTGGTQFLADIRSGAVDIYDATGTTLLQTVTGAPWSAAQAKTSSRQVRENELYIANNAFWTQVLTYDPLAGTWSLADYAFEGGEGGSYLQIYYRYAAPGIAIQPSAVSGSGISLVATSPIFVTGTSGHTGTRIQWNYKEILITAVTDSTHATGTVIDTLPPTVSVTVADASGYRLGEDVQGLTSLAQGTIINISSNTITCVMVNGYESFLDDNIIANDIGSSANSGEYLVGPFTRSYITQHSKSSLSPGSSSRWTEALISQVHGYPGTVFERSSRLGFAGFPDLPDGLALSAPGAEGDFDVGTGTAGDAIFVRVGDGDGQKIIHCVNGPNLVVLTDRGAMFVPESTSIPLSFETFSCVPIGPIGAGPALPAVVPEGVVYADRTGSRVMGVLGTGNLIAPYEIKDLSAQADHLINGVTSLATTNGYAGAKERYIFAINADGTTAVLFFDSDPSRLGWVPWVINGSYGSMTQIDGVVFARTSRTIGGVAQYLIERLDADAQLDAQVGFSGGKIAAFANDTAQVVSGTSCYGPFAVANDGAISGLPVTPDDTFFAGWHFDVIADLWTPEPQEVSDTILARKRITRASVRTLNTGVFAVGIVGRTPQTRGTYDMGEDLDSPPPLRSEVWRRNFAGWEFEPCLEITRPVPHPVEILAVEQEITV